MAELTLRNANGAVLMTPTPTILQAQAPRSHISHVHIINVGPGFTAMQRCCVEIMHTMGKGYFPRTKQRGVSTVSLLLLLQ